MKARDANSVCKESGALVDVEAKYNSDERSALVDSQPNVKGRYTPCRLRASAVLWEVNMHSFLHYFNTI